MKKAAFKLISAVLVSAAVLSLAACGNESDGSNATTAATVQPTAAEPEASDKADISSLHSYDAENGDEFAGAWQITDGTGSQFEGFIYLFDGHGEADIMVDNMGYIGKYTLGLGEEGTENEGKKTIECNLIFGINGTYTYEIDGENAVLTDIQTEDKTSMAKVNSFDCIPIPDNNPVTDEALLGAWLSDSGEYFYFDKNGIMYQNQFQTMFTYSVYSAEDGKLISTYIMQDEVTDEYDYSVDGDTLTLNDYIYSRISADKLV